MKGAAYFKFLRQLGMKPRLVGPLASDTCVAMVMKIPKEFHESEVRYKISNVDTDTVM